MKKKIVEISSFLFWSETYTVVYYIEPPCIDVLDPLSLRFDLSKKGIFSTAPAQYQTTQEDEEIFVVPHVFSCSFKSIADFSICYVYTRVVLLDLLSTLKY